MRPGRLLYRLRARGAWRVPVLLYHRIAEHGADPFGLSVSEAHFQEHLDVLRRLSSPVPLRELVAALDGGDLPRRPAVLTFDDGYADNLHLAKPLLERADMPATVFVATAADPHGRGFWWDELLAIVLAAAGPITAVIRGKEYEWRLPDERPAEWQRTYRELWELLRTLDPTEREPILRGLRYYGPAGAGAAHPTLTADEIVLLADGGLLEIGAHTETHPWLAALSRAEQRRELDGSKRTLEELLGRRVESFSYPFGGPNDFDRTTVELVREAGFACACTTAARPARPGADRFRLPRIQVGDWDGDELAKRLAQWLGAGSLEHPVAPRP